MDAKGELEKKAETINREVAMSIKAASSAPALRLMPGAAEALQHLGRVVSLQGQLLAELARRVDQVGAA